LIIDFKSYTYKQKINARKSQTWSQTHEIGEFKAFKCEKEGIKISDFYLHLVGIKEADFE
jgi:hypothetical protein